MDLQLIVRRPDNRVYILHRDPNPPEDLAQASWCQRSLCVLKCPLALSFCTGSLVTMCSLAFFISCFVTESQDQIFPQLCTDAAMTAYPLGIVVGIAAMVVSGCAMGCLESCRRR